MKRILFLAITLAFVFNSCSNGDGCECGNCVDCPPPKPTKPTKPKESNSADTAKVFGVDSIAYNPDSAKLMIYKSKE